MNPKSAIAVGLLCLIVAVCLFSIVQPAYAQVDDAPKTGLGEVFKKREATGEGPTKAQLALTIGSTIVMIAVLKYV